MPLTPRDFPLFDTALHLLGELLVTQGAAPQHLVVCGGTALLAARLVSRATKDVDVVALLGPQGELVDPAPLPEAITTASKVVAQTLGLAEDWLNNGPSSGDGGLFRMGLPLGFVDRLSQVSYGTHLAVSFISRLDQIHFKLYAAVDQYGSYHAADLKALAPSDEELLLAACWSMTHDVSEGYRSVLCQFLKDFGYAHLIDRL